MWERRDQGQAARHYSQVMLTFSCDGRQVTVHTFIQPESEQHCLIGMNVIPFLGITVKRANEKPLYAVAEQVAQVRLIQTITIPGQKGRLVEVQVESDGCEISFYLNLSIRN